MHIAIPKSLSLYNAGFPTGLATIQFNESCYSVAEGEEVSVCAELLLPSGTTSLGCDISVLFSATSGDRAGLCSC